MSDRIELADGWTLWPLGAVRGAGMPFEWLEELSDDPAAGLARIREQPSFLAALAWQNPGVEAWAGRSATSLTSYRSGVLARYLQRYCARNDSIGFFGPVGWATFASGGGEALAATGGAGLRSAHVSLELWAVRELAAGWAAEPAVAPYVPIRLLAGVAADGDQLLRPHRPSLALDPAAARVVKRLTGREPVTTAQLDADEREAVRLLVAEGAAVAEFPLPPSTHPERDLRDALSTVPAGATRDACLVELDAIIAILAEAEKSADDPERIGDLLSELYERLAAVGVSTRKRDENATGRTPAYVDCRRDLDVTVGNDLAEAAGPALALLLQSARWISDQLRQAVDEHLVGVHEQLRRGREAVTLADLQLAAADVLTGSPGTVAEEIGTDFRLRWQEVISSSTGTEPVHLSSGELADYVEALFPADRPGWAAARHHSPDLLPATSEHPDGRPVWVLGELHVGMNTLESRFFHTLCDEPDRLVALTAEDMAGGRAVPGYPFSEAIDSRRYPPLAVDVPERYVHWAPVDDMGAGGAARSIAGTELHVRRADGGLVAGPADGTWSLPVCEFFGEYLSALAVNMFRLPAPGPRVSIDELVVRRASWTFTVNEFPAAAVSKAGYRPNVLADLLRSRGVSRHVFATMPGEPKPVYVDVGSSLLVTNLARLWRRAPAGTVWLHEMLPGPDQLWLRDRHGHRYTSELRFVAVDPRARQLSEPNRWGAQL